MQELVGKKVEIKTVDILYRGVLIEIGEKYIHLQAETGWIIVPVKKVVDIKAVKIPVPANRER